MNYQVFWNGFFLLIFSFLLYNCLGPEIEELDFIEVKTNSPTPIGIDELILTGSVLRTVAEKGELEDHGFIWAENWNSDLDDLLKERQGVNSINLGKFEEGEFEYAIRNLKIDGALYTFRAFVKDKGKIIYGSPRQFSYSVVVQMDTIVTRNNGNVTISGAIFGLENLRASVADHGHIISKDTSNLYLDKAFFKKTSLKRSNDDGVFQSKLENLDFNNIYFTKAYIIKQDGHVIYSKKTLKFSSGGGWRRVATRLPISLAHALGGAIGNSGYLFLGCTDDFCLVADGAPTETVYRFEVKSDTSGKWVEIPDYSGIPTKKSIAFTLNNKLYVTLGDRGFGNRFNTKEIWTFDPIANAGQGNWALTDTFPGPGREGAITFAIGGKAYIGSGRAVDRNGNEIFYSDVYEYNPDAPRGQRWRQIADLPTKSQNNAGRSEAVAFALNNKGYVGTGFSACCELNDFWCYNLQTNQWTEMDALPAIPRRGAIAFASQNAKGYVGTGFSGTNSAYLKDFWIFDPLAKPGNQWQIEAEFPAAGRSHASVFVVQDRAYIGGGRSFILRNNNLDFLLFSDFWVYTPEKL